MFAEPLLWFEEPEYEPEPDCTCIRLDVDYYDASYCELCNTDGDYNRRLRAMERDAAPRDQEEFIGERATDAALSIDGASRAMTSPTSSEDCPF